MTAQPRKRLAGAAHSRCRRAIWAAKRGSEPAVGHRLGSPVLIAAPAMPVPGASRTPWLLSPDASLAFPDNL
jgi:hypothetical protein